ncbi:MAG: 50S ribosomal protein L29 [Deltaproteobacteria bacterium]
MKATELKALKADELRAKDQELKKELFNLKMRHAGGTLENPLRLRILRRDIARVKTILRNKEKGA